MLPSFESNGFIFRWIAVNVFWLALTITSLLMGWLQIIFSKDITYISYGITAVFVVALILSGLKAWAISTMFNNVSGLAYHYTIKLEELKGDKEGVRGDYREAMKNRMMAYIASISYIGNALVVTGLIGTVIGLIIAFSNVSPELALDISTLGPMVATLLSGLSVAFVTTLFGAICSLWLKTNYFIMAQAMSYLYAKVLEY